MNEKEAFCSDLINVESDILILICEKFKVTYIKQTILLIILNQREYYLRPELYC